MKCLEKENNSSQEGYSSLSRWNFYLYIGKISFGIWIDTEGAHSFWLSVNLLASVFDEPISHSHMDSYCLVLTMVKDWGRGTRGT